MNELMNFSNEIFGNIRVLEIEGKPYFVANDVLKALGYAEGGWSTTLKRKCKGVTNCKGLEYRGNLLNIIPEGDVYRLIMGSKLDSADKFERWVFDEVLVQIRTTGGYVPIEKDMSDAEIMARALMIAQNTINKKDRIISELQPKAEIYDAFVDKEVTFGFRELRKELESSLNIKIKETELKRIMREDFKWISGNSVKRLLANCIRDGYAVTKDDMDRNGNPIVVDRFTMKAREELYKYFKEVM